MRTPDLHHLDDSDYEHVQKNYNPNDGEDGATIHTMMTHDDDDDDDDGGGGGGGGVMMMFMLTLMMMAIPNHLLCHHRHHHAIRALWHQIRQTSNSRTSPIRACLPPP